MALKQRKPNTTSNTKKELNTISKDVEVENNVNKGHFKHFIPMPLLFTIMVCSGFLWIISFRDVFATGRAIFGPIDERLQEFIKSDQFFDLSEGGYFKSKAGGLSAISSATTDKNNMGGLFVRKMCGAAGLIVHSQKLVAVLFQSNNNHWHLGHFNPMFYVASFGDLAVALFLLTKMDDLRSAKVEEGTLLTVLVLVFEALVIFAYTLSNTRKLQVPKPRFHIPGKKPNTVVSRILMRTIAIVTGLITIIAGRDLFYPGTIIGLIPRDDIYLEWTGALIHSPSADTVEEYENSLQSSFFIGDKFVSQLGSLYLLITCFYKFATAFFIRVGKDKSGELKCKIIWRVQALGDVFILFIMRLFSSASLTASLDLRWHLMCIAYETFMLGKSIIL